ncbi:CRISPR-associated Cas5e family protein [Brevibacterium sanguinis]|uniref:CRISPR-associated Cas5e family protein n=2 Tax=Brevibacterium TaxID=1696 RepID=A0A366ILQ3_9MICO|nr:MULTISPECIES: type I-E CRISPR-associated protein Cas5/CasD [Brevibacterium]RBP65568.1 CRISPR-associated Cas5e family protein [Brevibacterium sanguinis]RBP72202.1 CRISPR-associated Cas5e family protein [Brevibacterium celere]
MSTLLLRLAGPMQSWGMRGRFTRRTTELQPTKSGIVGLVAAAMGRRRTDPIEDLANLRFGVRVDQPGRLMRDFQTASRPGVTAPLSYRYFLSDAVFLAALEGPDELIDGIDDALQAPSFPLYLGRRAFPPAGKVSLGVQRTSMPEVLSETPWSASRFVMKATKNPVVYVRIVRDAEPGEEASDAFEDVPLSFDPNRRQFGMRSVCELRVKLSNPCAADDDAQRAGGAFDSHDPFGFLGGPSVSQQN